MAIDEPGFEGADQMRQMLLRSIAEQLKLPMLYIARQAELSRADETVSFDTLDNMQANAEMALRLIDSYILGFDLAAKQLALELEPVPLTAVLYDVAHDLTPIARQRNTTIELTLDSKQGEVMANSQGLAAALYSMGSVLSEVCAEKNGKGTLHIAAHRAAHGIVTGIYTDGIDNIQTTIYQARKLRQNFVRQPYLKLCAGSGAGIFIADTIFTYMNARLRAGRLHGKHGLAATLEPSRQMQLV
jgi:hypothetical protein